MYLMFCLITFLSIQCDSINLQKALGILLKLYQVCEWLIHVSANICFLENKALKFSRFDVLMT